MQRVIQFSAMVNEILFIEKNNIMMCNFEL